MPRYEVSGPVDVDGALGAGFVAALASDRTDVVGEVLPTKPGRSGDVSMAREAVVSFEAGRLRISVPRRLNLFGQSDSVDVRCQLPTGSRATVRTAYGSVRAAGVLGDCRITAKYGNVTADAVGDLVLDSPHGTIEVEEVTGRLDATVGHGHMRIGHVDDL